MRLRQCSTPSIAAAQVQLLSVVLQDVELMRSESRFARGVEDYHFHGVDAARLVRSGPHIPLIMEQADSRAQASVRCHELHEYTRSVHGASLGRPGAGLLRGLL